MATKSRASLQTFHALQATDLAAAMNDSIKKVRVGPGNYVPELTAPEGPSTAGGVQAMQHLRLVSAEPGRPTLVVGYANHAAGKAELRTYEHVDAIHRQRFQRPLDLDRPQYDEFISFAMQLFGALHLQTTLVEAPPDLGAATALAASAPPRPVAAVGIALFVAAIAAVGMGVWVLVHSG